MPCGASFTTIRSKILTSFGVEQKKQKETDRDGPGATCEGECLIAIHDVRGSLQCIPPRVFGGRREKKKSRESKICWRERKKVEKKKIKNASRKRQQKCRGSLFVFIMRSYAGTCKNAQSVTRAVKLPSAMRIFDSSTLYPVFLRRPR